MKLLAWDTSSKSGAIVALEWDASGCSSWRDVRLVSEFMINVDSVHSERLLWGIHQVLEAARWQIEDVDVLAVGVGPGSFTGLRIGITTARTLSHTLNKPLVGVSSLAALARPIALQMSRDELPFETLVIAATDACKGELFALWGKAKSVAASGVVSPNSKNPQKLWNSEVQELVLKPELLIESIQEQLSNEDTLRWVVVGEGRKRYSEQWKRLPSSKELLEPIAFEDYIQGKYLGLLAWEATQAGYGREGLQIHPIYLRASDAELKLKSGLLKPSPVGTL
jgi:tRNA threonylcarbamoyl adenosine modification protein YeaZ